MNITLYIKKEQRKLLEKIAKEERRSMSQVVGVLIERRAQELGITLKEEKPPKSVKST